MDYLDVSIKDQDTNKTNRYVISNDDHVVHSDNIMHAFTVYWPDGEVAHLLLNPKRQPVAEWQAKFHNMLISSNEDTFKNRLKTATAIGLPSIVAGGPKAGVAGIVVGAFFAKKINNLWNDFWNMVIPAHGDDHAKPGYYDLETGERDRNFPNAIHISDIVVNSHHNQLPWDN